ncbi:hypothetical protein PGT21_028639 [Puccinia graminis f. sp. tritici]|uniref:Uncharacterized protein n=1 Tax=Puccinia graminis f. sp. tritici TaxID=56615 RepID=A0A5B0RTJ0_PUCGR|nr:hypothetical protein PGT21_028639 [Puccinia graminis f. sp. tritici]KAA1128345.1 hypothetical protein PGTUg99_011595 [Puccinia graminis f. sp. tritici]
MRKRLIPAPSLHLGWLASKDDARLTWDRRDCRLLIIISLRLMLGCQAGASRFQPRLQRRPNRAPLIDYIKLSCVHPTEPSPLPTTTLNEAHKP